MIIAILLTAWYADNMLSAGQISNQGAPKWHFEKASPGNETTGTVQAAALVLADNGDNTADPGRAVFSDISYAMQGNRITLEGYVYDSITKDRIPDLPVAVYCDGRVISDPYARTDSDGLFDITPDPECTSGDEAWLETEYNGRVYESDHIFLPERENNARNIHISSTHGPSNPVSGVPEFSTPTLVIAVIAVTLGIAFLRKHT